MQGDIIQIVNASGTLVAEYRYDAWGNIGYQYDNGLNIANINPYRYRSYRYDSDTGLYYLNSRYYDSKIGRFISADSINYLDPATDTGLNLYAYCGNNPVMYSDPSGNFPILATILIISAIAGLGLTIGGVATDNNTMTAIGLTMVAIPALVSGGLALFGTTGALAHLIGGVTMVAGAGTGAFASAEWQQTFTGDNWMLDAGMSEGLYNTLMITTATIATLGTAASSFAYSFNINSIQKVGKLGDYNGMRFTQKAPSGNLRYKSIEFHTPHNGHGYHWQQNTFNGLIGKRTGSTIRWTWWLKRIIGG
ncbi:RHS repeat-associated core domain-containing protein [Acholeplasma granularum]|uniref:RHS repeat-associated core domain-containing protein n=1 Tax=Acholeplasma granularum TaxID=264635 RepID=UPI0004B88CF4|nr:RHS repeat-associated core domain-containing protein [Acholeplasma granularum]